VGTALQRHHISVVGQKRKLTHYPYFRVLAFPLSNRRPSSFPLRRNALVNVKRPLVMHAWCGLSEAGRIQLNFSHLFSTLP
jgi:hypothetical protein